MSEKEYKNNICPLCKKEGEYLFATTDRGYGGPGIFYVFHCKHCLIDFIECPSNLSDYYEAGYYTDFAVKKSSIYKIKAKIINSYYTSEKNTWHKLVHRFLLGFIAAMPDKKGRLLDVGCGPGDVIYLLKRVGFDLYGLDISEHAVKVAHKNGLDNVILGTEDKINSFPDGYFDYIRASHVVEHMLDPVGFFNDCYKKLCDGGSLLISTPNINSFNRFIFGKYTKCYTDIPRHLILFSDKSLVKILKSARFNNIKVTYTTVYSDFYEGFYSLLDYKFKISKTPLGKKLHRNIILNFLLLPIDLISVLFRKGETIAITATK